MKALIITVSLFATFGLLKGSGWIDWNEEEIHGYHFHTYFYQNNAQSSEEAVIFRNAIQDQITNGGLQNCRLNHLNLGPRGPHPIGSYETCCNKTSISPALSWFMQNRGNLTILLHALTRYEIEDHTTRSMFIGPRIPLDTSVLSEDLGENLDLCLPITSNSKEHQPKPKSQQHRKNPQSNSIYSDWVI